MCIHQCIQRGRHNWTINTILNVKFKWNENEVKNSASHLLTSTRQSHAKKFMRLNVYEREKYICVCIDMLIDCADCGD